MTPLDAALAGGIVLAAVVVGGLAVVTVVALKRSRAPDPEAATTAATAAVDAWLRKAATPGKPAAPFDLAAPSPPPSAIAARVARTASVELHDVLALAATVSGGLDAFAAAGVARTVSGASTLSAAASDADRKSVV